MAVNRECQLVLLARSRAINSEVEGSNPGLGLAFQDVSEDWSSIRNRQKIQKLVLAGKMGEAIAVTDKLYPGFLQVNTITYFT